MVKRNRVILLLAFVAGLGAATVGTLSAVSRPQQGKTIRWEYLEAEEGDDLYRLETPTGWLVYNEETGDLEFVSDANKEWLEKN